MSEENKIIVKTDNEERKIIVPGGISIKEMIEMFHINNTCKNEKIDIEQIISPYTSVIDLRSEK